MRADHRPRALTTALLAAGLGIAWGCPSPGEDDDASPADDDAADDDTGPGTGCDAPPWVQVIGEGGLDECWGATWLEGGDLAVACHQTAEGEGRTHGVVRRLAPDGAQRWETPWEGEGSLQLFQVLERHGALWVGGLIWEAGHGLYDPSALLLRLDAATGEVLDGRVAWSTPGWDEVDGIEVLDDGGVVLSGFAEGAGGTQDVRVTRRDAALEEIWTVDWDRSGQDDAANGHLAVESGRVLVAAAVDGEGLTLWGAAAAVAAFDLGDGSLAWSEVLGEESTRAEALGLASDGAAVYAVGDDLTGPDTQLLVAAWDLDGTRLWTRLWGGEGQEYGRAVAADPAGGGLIVAGNTTSSGAGETDIALLRLDRATGEVLEERVWGGAGEDAAHEVALGGGRFAIAAQTGSWGAGAEDGLVLAGCLSPPDWPAPPP
ncbi:hypothetical protein L6R50_02790 [Myxococcota bacterium]|nr:hypothetical protein [Myxococcota bacterium]